MKKLLLVLLLVTVGILNAYKLSDFTIDEQEQIKDGLISEISLKPNETIESVEGQKYDITEATDDYWIVIDDQGNPIIIQKRK